MIGEDGLMTAAAGERYAGLTVAEAQARVVADLEAARRDPRARGVRPHRAVQPALRRARRAADLAAVVHAHGRARRARRSTPCVFGHIEIHPESQARRYVDWLQEIRPWCISRQLWWGHQIPVWYRGGETYVGASRPRATAGSRTRTSSTRGSRRRCGRSRRSAGPSARPSSRPSTRPTCSRRGATSSFSGSRGWSCSACASPTTSRSSTSTSIRSSRRPTGGG